MARPIALETPPRDLRKEREEQLKQARIDHAEAILNAYELVEQLHASRTFELLRGALGASGQITEKVAAAADTPQAVNGVRNLILLTKMLGSIDPEIMESWVAAAAGTLGHKPNPDTEPPGLFALLSQLRRRETRRALMLGTRFLAILGGRLGQKHGTDQKA
ncbi:MAG TPA: hypothetical protein VGG26_05955 [Terracidiphilus sp.]|jgi:uncharacterized protein YjgD (DUF1641 family)